MAEILVSLLAILSLLFYLSSSILPFLPSFNEVLFDDEMIDQNNIYE